MPVIAKIEKPQALEKIDEIVEAFDGIMVARGDLGVECPLEDVPVPEAARRQARPARQAGHRGHPDARVDDRTPAPTRAEASDIANAVLDGADAVMLSGETSVGEYPIEAVETMARIIESTEDHGLARMAAPSTGTAATRGGTIAQAAVDVAVRIGAQVPGRVHPERRLRPPAGAVPGPHPGAGVHPRARTRSQLSMTWGVETFRGDVEHTDEMVAPGRRAAAPDRSRERGRRRRHRRRQPARHPRLHQRAAHPPDGRRHQRGRARLPPADRRGSGLRPDQLVEASYVGSSRAPRVGVGCAAGSSGCRPDRASSCRVDDVVGRSDELPRG